MEELKRLTRTQQAYLLAFIKAMLSEPKEASSGLLRFAGGMDAGDLDEMWSSIEEDCGKIDYDGW